LRLADVETTQHLIKIVRSRGPYFRDLKRTPAVMWYPIFLFSAMLIFVQSRHQIDSRLVPIFCLAPLCIYLVPIMIRLAEGLRKLRLLLDTTTKLVYRNGEIWSDFENVVAVTIVTQSGLMVYRRFRLIIEKSNGCQIHVVETPLLEDWSMTAYYSQQIRQDQLEFEYGGYWAHVLGPEFKLGPLWRPYIKGMRGFDPADPLIVEIFALRELIAVTISNGQES
jgi:hypothetical protein